MACGVRAAIETGATIQGQCGGSDWQFAAGMATPQRKARGGNGEETGRKRGGNGEERGRKRGGNGEETGRKGGGKGEERGRKGGRGGGGCQHDENESTGGDDERGEKFQELDFHPSQRRLSAAD